jgi:hypothetical protein
VDAFIERLRALPDTAEGRREACELARSIRFHHAHRYGYPSVQVDRFIADAIKSWRGMAQSPPEYYQDYSGGGVYDFIRRGGAE